MPDDNYTPLPTREPAKSRAPKPRRRRSTYVPGRIPKQQKTKFERRLDETMKAVAMVLPPDPRQQKDDSDDPTRGRNLDLSFSVGTPKDHFGFWVGVHSVKMIRGMTGAPAETLVVFSLNDFGVVGPWRPDYEYSGPRRFLSETKDAIELAKACLVENKNVEEDDVLIRCNASYAEPTASQLFKFMQDPAFNFLPKTSDVRDLTPEEMERPNEAPSQAEKPVGAADADEPTALANSGLVENDPPEEPVRRRHRRAAPAVSSTVSTSDGGDYVTENVKRSRRAGWKIPKQTLPLEPVQATFVRSRHRSHPIEPVPFPSERKERPRRRSRLGLLLGGMQ